MVIMTLIDNVSSKGCILVSHLCFFSVHLFIIIEQISILELFLKDHVTLKTGLIMLKILCVTGINYILQYIKIYKLF